VLFVLDIFLRWFEMNCAFVHAKMQSSEGAKKTALFVLDVFLRWFEMNCAFVHAKMQSSEGTKKKTAVFILDIFLRCRKSFFWRV
jgi:hypothetical protein